MLSGNGGEVGLCGRVKSQRQQSFGLDMVVRSAEAGVRSDERITPKHGQGQIVLLRWSARCGVQESVLAVVQAIPPVSGSSVARDCAKCHDSNPVSSQLRSAHDSASASVLASKSPLIR